MLTWQADDGHGLESTRLVFGSGGLRALGRMVRTGPGPAFTASYRLVVGDDGTVQRLSVTTATAERERHLTLNRTEDGFWLLDTGGGAGGARSTFDGAVDVDLDHSPLFNTLPIRRLGLHRTAGEHTVPMVYVTLPDLEARPVSQVYSTVSTLDESGTAVVGFQWDDFTAEITVDSEGLVQRYPGIGSLLEPVSAG